MVFDGCETLRWISSGAFLFINSGLLHLKNRGLPKRTSNFRPTNYPAKSLLIVGLGHLSSPIRKDSKGVHFFCMLVPATWNIRHRNYRLIISRRHTIGSPWTRFSKKAPVGVPPLGVLPSDTFGFCCPKLYNCLSPLFHHWQPGRCLLLRPLVSNLHDLLLVGALHQTITINTRLLELPTMQNYSATAVCFDWRRHR